MFELQQGDIANLKGAVCIYSGDITQRAIIRIEGANLDSVMGYFSLEIKDKIREGFAACTVRTAPRFVSEFPGAIHPSFMRLDIIDCASSTKNFDGISEQYFLIYGAQGLAELSRKNILRPDELEYELAGLAKALYGAVSSKKDPDGEELYSYAIRSLTRNIPARAAVDNLIGFARTRHPMKNQAAFLFIDQICASYLRDIDSASNFSEQLKLILGN